MIKVISFDIGGTLLEESNVSSNNYNLKNLSELVNMPYDKVRDVYKNVYQKSKGTFDELLNKFCSNLEISNTCELNNFFKNKFSNNNLSTISKDKINLIKRLKENKYKVILFSNSCCLLNNDAIKEIYGLVDNIFYSYDIGYTKDDKESYNYIENVLNIKSNEILHIGDTLKSDYLKPIENGWNALYYGNNIDDVKSINNLCELDNYLENI